MEIIDYINVYFVGCFLTLFLLYRIVIKDIEVGEITKINCSDRITIVIYACCSWCGVIFIASLFIKNYFKRKGC